MPDTVTRIVVRVQSSETRVYMIDGTVDASAARDLIESGEYDPVDSDVHAEDVDVLSVETRTI